MKLIPNRINMIRQAPEEVREALFTIGHWLAKISPDFNANFNVTEGDEVITYELEIREVNRVPWIIEGEINNARQDKKI